MLRSLLVAAALVGIVGAYSPPAAGLSRALRRPGVRAPAVRVRASLVDASAEELRNAPNPAATPNHDILLRAAKGHEVERTPVWLMRQAGRYMRSFREFSTK
jgi:hypothetical protein